MGDSAFSPINPPFPPCSACIVLQAYRVAQRSFLPKDWIMEQWDKGFYITGGWGGCSSPYVVGGCVFVYLCVQVLGVG